MSMLQLPSKSPRFSPAQIADITRGGKFTAREPKAAPDPTVRAVATLVERIAEYQKANSAFEQKRATLAPQDAAGDPFLFVFPPDGGRPLVNVGTDFFSLYQIDRHQKARQKELRETIADCKRRLRRPSQLKYETRQRLQGALNDLAALPICASAIKRRFREHCAKISQIQRAADYTKFKNAEDRASDLMFKAYYALLRSKTTSHAGALALIDCSTVIMRSSAFPASVVPKLLERARLYLGTKTGGPLNGKGRIGTT